MFICCTICKGNAISQVITFTDAKIYRHNNILLQTSPIATVSPGHLIEPEIAISLRAFLHIV